MSEKMSEVLRMDYWDLSPEQVALVFGSYKELLKRLEIVRLVPGWDRDSALRTHVWPLLLEDDDDI